MTRRKSNQEDIRKITKIGDSYAITIPIALIREFGWRKGQKVVVTKRGKRILIKDWE